MQLTTATLLGSGVEQHPDLDQDLVATHDVDHFTNIGPRFLQEGKFLPQQPNFGVQFVALRFKASQVLHALADDDLPAQARGTCQWSIWGERSR
jgi:hypothetical protein